MKKSMIRVLALALVLGGLIANHHAYPVQAATHMRNFSAQPDKMPIPVCPPNDPHGCNIDKW